jgi:hypothetical protein
MKLVRIALALAFFAASAPAFADRWFGCGRILKLNSYGTAEIRFDIEGVNYTGLCDYQTAYEYGHHSLARTTDNQWVFAMYLAAAVSGRSVKLFAPDNSTGRCSVQNVPIKYCDE